MVGDAHPTLMIVSQVFELMNTLRLCAFAPLRLCAFAPLRLCAFAPLRSWFFLFRNSQYSTYFPEEPKILIDFSE